MGRGFSSDVEVVMLTEIEFMRNIRVLIFNHRKKPSLSQINLLTNTELGELLNELPIQQKNTFMRVAAGLGWDKIAKCWGISVNQLQLEYQLACRYLCKRILDYSESLGFKNEKYLSEERVAFMRNKFSALRGDALRGIAIEALGLSSKTYNTLAFKMNGIGILKQIRMLDMYELSRMEGVGDKTIEELKYVIKVWK